MWRSLRSAFENPVLVRDLRTRMRGARAFVILAVYLSIVAIVLMLVYSAVHSGPRGMAAASLSKPKTISHALYAGLFATQAAIVLLLVPALTAGSITIEHEQQTFDMLTVTRLSPSAIVWGRLGSSISFTLLLLMTSLPVVSVCFLLGGVSPHEVLASYVAIIICTFVVGGMGVLSSSLVTRTVPATILTFTFVFVYLVATLLTSSLPMAMPLGASAGPFACLNPFMAISVGSDYVGFFNQPALVPAWLSGAAVGILGGLLLVTTAVDRVSVYFSDRSPWRARLLVGILLLLTAFLVMGWTWAVIPRPAAGSATAFHPGSLAAYMCVLLAGVGLLAPMMCSSPGMSAPGSGNGAPRAKHLLEPGAVNGTVYLLAILAVSVPVMLVGFWLGGVTSATVDWGRVGSSLAIVAVSMLCCIGFTWAFLGIFGSRAAAAGVTYGLMFVTLAVPPWLAAMWAMTGAFPNRPTEFPWVTNLVYLDPFLALIEIASPGSIAGEFKGALLYAGVAPFHAVTLGALAGLTVVSLLLALVASGVRRVREAARQTKATPPGPTQATMYRE